MDFTVRNGLMAAGSENTANVRAVSDESCYPRTALCSGSRLYFYYEEATLVRDTWSVIFTRTGACRLNLAYINPSGDKILEHRLRPLPAPMVMPMVAAPSVITTTIPPSDRLVAVYSINGVPQASVPWSAPGLSGYTNSSGEVRVSASNTDDILLTIEDNDIDSIKVDEYVTIDLLTTTDV